MEKKGSFNRTDCKRGKQYREQEGGGGVEA